MKIDIINQSNNNIQIIKTTVLNTPINFVFLTNISNVHFFLHRIAFSLHRPRIFFSEYSLLISPEKSI